MTNRESLGEWLANRPAWWVPALALLSLPAFPPLEWHGAAWIGLAPVMFALRTAGGGPWAWAAAGWGFGMVFFGANFAWLHRVLVELAGMGLLHFSAFAALLVGSLALLPALGFWLARQAWARHGISPAWVLAIWFSVQDLLLGVFPFGGVAWGSPAATQAHTLAARLAVPWVGGAGLVLLLGLVNAGWARLAIAMLARPPGRPRAALSAAFSTVLAALTALTVLCAWPAPLHTTPPAPSPGSPRLSVLAVPGGLSIAELDAAKGTQDTVRYYLLRTLDAMDHRPAPDGGRERTAGGNENIALAIWPESAVRGREARGQALVELSALAGLTGTDFLLGSNATNRGRDLNSVYLVDGGGGDFRRYDKINLVPFGEYVPAGFGWLFGKKITRGNSDFASGSGPPVLEWRGTRLGVAICFESALPGHIRRSVRAGAEWIVAVANDAWLTPAAARQHLRLTALRGLEAGRDVLFVSNGGWSALLRGGQVVTGGGKGVDPFWVRPVLRSGRTPWTRWGPWPLALAIGAVTVLGLWRRRSNPAS